MADIENSYQDIAGLDVDQVICMATLYANNELTSHGLTAYTMQEVIELAEAHWQRMKEDCGNCPYVDSCLLCRLNE